MNKSCDLNDSSSNRIIHSKKAIGACMFISFFVYTVTVILSEAKRGSKVSRDHYWEEKDKSVWKFMIKIWIGEMNLTNNVYSSQ